MIVLISSGPPITVTFSSPACPGLPNYFKDNGNCYYLSDSGAKYTDAKRVSTKTIKHIIKIIKKIKYMYIYIYIYTY